MRKGEPGAAIEIACDESGYEGEKLIGGTTDVFAHASTRLSVAESADSILELRSRIRSPAQEYKANHLLREKHRAILVWWLGPEGPVLGESRVVLVDKTFRLIRHLVQLLTETGDIVAAEAAETLYREGSAEFGEVPWRVFLDSFNDLVRAKHRLDATVPAPDFLDTVAALGLADGDGPAAGVLTLLSEDGIGFMTRAQGQSRLRAIPALDPLIPSILQAVAFWGDPGKPVSIVHDRQNLLTRLRIARLEELALETDLGLSGVELVDSMADPRVQVADFLAGVARKIASEELNGRGDPELTALLSEHVASDSEWGDERSWTRLSVD